MLNEEELKRLHDKMYEQETLDSLAKSWSLSTISLL